MMARLIIASKITVETPSKNSELFSRVVNFKLYPLTAHVNTASLPTKHDKRPNAHLSERRTSSNKSKLVAFNLVANAPHRFDDLFATGSSFDFIAQVADVNHDRLSRNHGLLLPNSFKNIIRTENTLYSSGVRQGLEKGMERGREEGRMEGRKEGMEVGVLKGRKEGQKDEKIANARKMKSYGLALEMISDITGLTIDEVRDL